MSTCYTIHLGYSDTHNTNDSNGIALLKQVAIDVAADAKSLVIEAFKVTAPPGDPNEPYLAYATVYSAKEGCPWIWLARADNYPYYYVYISCSGGNPSRAIKEWVANAFVRLVILKMNQLGYNVQVEIS